MPRAKVGRPSKLDPERKERILSALKAGNFRQVACEYAGVGFTTFARWMSTGARRPASEFGKFRQAVLEAERQAEVGCVARVMKATEKDWKAAAWWLERKRSARWSRKDRLEHSGPNGKAIPINAKVLHELSDDDADKIEAILRRASDAKQDAQDEGAADPGGVGPGEKAPGS